MSLARFGALAQVMIRRESHSQERVGNSKLMILGYSNDLQVQHQNDQNWSDLNALAIDKFELSKKESFFSLTVLKAKYSSEKILL